MNKQTDSLQNVNLIEISRTSGTSGTLITVIIRSSFEEPLQLAFNDHLLDTKQTQVQGITSLVALIPDMSLTSFNGVIRICFMNGNLVTKTWFVSDFFYESKRNAPDPITNYKLGTNYSADVLQEPRQLVSQNQEQTSHSSNSISYNPHIFPSSIAKYHPYPGLTYLTNLEILSDMNAIMRNWNANEWTSCRRLVQFWRQREKNEIKCTFQPIQTDQIKRAKTRIVSCIFWLEKNDYFITSVDLIGLVEYLLDIDLNIEEKNRIRRNLEGFRPLTVSKSKLNSTHFFKLIMSYPDPKPRNIEKDLKVFAWRSLPFALKKIVAKYSAQDQRGKRIRSDCHNIPQSALTSAQPDRLRMKEEDLDTLYKHDNKDIYETLIKTEESDSKDNKDMKNIVFA
ncbi:hypothetical protein G6F57_013659 [Rhizopus arrhizus]|nr:hypothetical protein G6F30_012662 [Rhizopus arrhizus]KAG0973691.1 hypothetical protein G6F29_012687 [Rhizopus arrhizus]KAG1001628.1 hypothetical protein G6F27_012696 [Rhizopus arrhizus]KAG1016260.1 hypothetical protein G6F26_012665 [Rhizopus arrhizus]KAG1026060.1 hypothetical protein G6F25_012723 [Rhizopus arrhizus]